MKLSKQMAKAKLIAIKNKYPLTENEKQAVDKGIKALSRSQELSSVIKEIEDLHIQFDDEGNKLISYDDVMYLLSKCK